MGTESKKIGLIKLNDLLMTLNENNVQVQKNVNKFSWEYSCINLKCAFTDIVNELTMEFFQIKDLLVIISRRYVSYF